MTAGWLRINKGWSWMVLGVGSLLAACGADVGGGAAANNGQTLCYSDYVTCINPIYNAAMQNRTGQNIQCASGGCHEVGGGFAGSLRVYPNTVDPDELLVNFTSSLSNANLGNPVASKLLLKPLVGTAGNNGAHTGGDILPDTSDSCYAAILAWITNSVADANDPLACGSCTPPVLASCGYP